MTAPTRNTYAAAGQSAAELRNELAADRDLDAVWREDTRARKAGAVEHRDALADVEEHAAAAKRARRERATDAREAQKLNALYRRATRSGERARLRARIVGSAEVRALRVAKVRTVTLAVGIPVLLAFAAWSTTGVQAGVVRLLNLDAGSAAWWAAWIVEPAAIAVVAGIIVGRAILRSSGGKTDWRAAVAECSFLTGSLLLNVVGGWPAGSGWDGLTSALPHAIGPAGAAATAWLIGVFDGYVAAARPWDGAPRLADFTDATPSEVGSESRRVAPAPSDASLAAETDAIDPAAVELVAAAARRAERAEWWTRLAETYGDQVPPEVVLREWMVDQARETRTVPSYRKARDVWGRCPGARRYAELRDQVAAEVFGQIRAHTADDMAPVGTEMPEHEAPEPLSLAPADAISHTAQPAVADVTPHLAQSTPAAAVQVPRGLPVPAPVTFLSTPELPELSDSVPAA